MTDERIPHPTEVGVSYAVARSLIEHERVRRFHHDRPRSNDYILAVGGLDAIGELATYLGVVEFRSTARALLSDVLADRPPAPGPLWVHEAALDLAERLDARRAGVR